MRYARPAEVETEFTSEWKDLGEFLQHHGGLETVIQRANERFASGDLVRRKSQSITAIFRQTSTTSSSGRNQS